jgi:dUTP pyrophosphatase
MVAIINLSGEEQTITDGERIAQMVITKYETAVWLQTDTLTDTQRGAGGFGHSGTN